MFNAHSGMDVCPRQENGRLEERERSVPLTSPRGFTAEYRISPMVRQRGGASTR
eukprot:SAG25_NODE_535_length_7114_cov_2.609408_4_plen_54_part_00